VVEADLNSFNIEFPSSGIFIIIQHPLLEQNKNYDPKSTNPNAFFYEPLISIDGTDEFTDSWYFQEEWKRSKVYSLNIELLVSD
jgi:hypothetical protein